MKYILVCASVVLLSAFYARAEEDPSYEPFNKKPAEAPPKRAISLPFSGNSGNTQPAETAPKATQKSTRVQPPAPVVAPAPVYASEPAPPSGPKVKYILDGKPVYEGDPDPVADAEKRAKLSNNNPSKNQGAYSDVKSPLIIREDARTQPAPRNAYASETTVTTPTPVAPPRTPPAPAGSVRLDFGASTPPAREAYVPAPAAPALGAPGERKVKYILDGKPVYEGDPDPVLAAKNGAPIIPGSSLPPQANRAPFDDVTADRPLPTGQPAEARGQVMMEEYVAAGPTSSKAKKAYAAIAALKGSVEAISRHLENRGKSNAALRHISDDMLDQINDLVALWPKSPAFLELCATSKRSALVFNQELSQVPWTWTRVRWSFDSVVKEVRALRSYAKTMADAEPPPRAIVTKSGQVVYQDQEEPSPDAATTKREFVMKVERDEIQRLKREDAAREARKNKLQTDLDDK